MRKAYPSNSGERQLLVVNPYAGIITSTMKTAFNNAIDALLEDTACTVACTIVYGGQKFANCTNCTGNVYVPGGPIPFPKGKICPLCQGSSRREVEQTETVYLLPIFDNKKWRTTAIQSSAKYPYEVCETMSLLTLMPKLKAAKHIIIDSTNANYTRNIFKRVGEPEPLGFGDMRYILTAWEKV